MSINLSMDGNTMNVLIVALVVIGVLGYLAIINWPER